MAKAAKKTKKTEHGPARETVHYQIKSAKVYPEKKGRRKGEKQGKQEFEMRIPSPRRNRVHVLVKSMDGSSLITNSLKGANELNTVDIGIKRLEDKKNPGGKVTQKRYRDRNPKKEFEKSIYWIPGKKKQYGLPASGFRKSIVEVAKNLKKSGTAKIDGTDVQRNIWVESDVCGYIRLKTKAPHMREDIVRQSGQNRAPMLRYRAEFEKWEATIRLLYNPDMFSAEEVVNLLAHAGVSDGYAEKRIGKGYEHGGYLVKKVIKDEVVM